MKIIQVNDDQVTTGKEIAETLKKAYGWEKYELRPDRIEFREKNGVAGYVDRNGQGHPLDDPNAVLIGYSDCWSECFDYWVDFVWATDADGNPVAVHN